MIILLRNNSLYTSCGCLKERTSPFVSLTNKVPSTFKIVNNESLLIRYITITAKNNIISVKLPINITIPSIINIIFQLEVFIEFQSFHRQFTLFLSRCKFGAVIFTENFFVYMEIVEGLYWKSFKEILLLK